MRAKPQPIQAKTNSHPGPKTTSPSYSSLYRRQRAHNHSATHSLRNGVESFLRLTSARPSSPPVPYVLTSQFPLHRPPFCSVGCCHFLVICRHAGRSSSPEAGALPLWFCKHLPARYLRFRFRVYWSSGRDVAVDGGLLSSFMATETTTVARDAHHHSTRQPVRLLEQRACGACHGKSKRQRAHLGRDECRSRRW